MKLSEYTLSVLKNFATINPSLVLLPGTVQRTMEAEMAILAEASLEEITDSKFGIYDLDQFLGNVSTLTAPELVFNSKTVTMDDGSMSLTFYSCAPEMIAAPPDDKSISVSTPDFQFSLSNVTLAKILKLANMNSLPHLSIVGKNGEVILKAHERKNDTSNSVSTKVADYTGEDFIDSFKTANFRMLPDDYSVNVMHGQFAQFISLTRDLKYIIAMEI